MKISPVEPIAPAYQRMVDVLFRPFDLRKWLIIGFCSFLATLGEGGGGSSLQNLKLPFQSEGPGKGGFDLDSLMSSIQQYIPLAILIGSVVAVIVICLSLVMIWLSSRGRFMLLHVSATEDLSIGASWRRFRRQGNSLFVLRVIIGFASLFAVGLIAGACFGLYAIGDSTTLRLTAIVLAVMMGAPLLIVMMIIHTVLKQFCVLIMYKRPDLSAWEAFTFFFREMAPGAWGSILVFWLIRALLGAFTVLLVLVVCCLTCCLAMLPYVNSVVCLPIALFFLFYLVYFFQQFGEEWFIFPEDEPGALAAAEGTSFAPDGGVDSEPAEGPSPEAGAPDDRW